MPSALGGDVPEVAPVPEAIHQSVSMITHIDRAAGLIVIKLDGGRLLRLIVDNYTVGDDVATLEPGDFIRQHCSRTEAGTAKARLIRRVRPAWMEISSFEL